MEVALSLIGIAAAVLLIRLGWGGRKSLAVAGWVIAALALAWLARSDGAWGLAVGFTAGSICAVALVLYAGATSPSRAAGKAASRQSVTMPGGPEGVGRRILVFLAVVPLSFLAAQWLAFAINTAMKGEGALDANSVSTMLFIQPVVWSILMAWQMVLPGPRQMLIPPALATAAGIAIWMAA